MTPELLAPAGSPQAGYAALHYGADAVYLGLPRYSARADAENFSLDSLGAFTAWAHGLTPRRRVYVAINTLLQEDELADAAHLLPELSAFGVDALIVQDMGLAALARRLCPQMRLHASTQLAVHNREGARTLARLGFSRVVLGRELTLDEIRETSGEAIETEVFVHGALCYSYSGLCLFSSMAHGRSGNRGTCAQPCRKMCRVAAALPAFDHATRDPSTGLPFSLKDLALGGRVRDVAAGGAASLKIEGRKKSALYVAAVTHCYRRLLDGPVDEGELARLESDIRTIFSRPVTRFHLDGIRRAGTADPDVTGHRGAPMGTIQSTHTGKAGTWIRFTPQRAIERHDGLVIPVPGALRPFGFSVAELRTAANGRSVFESAAGEAVETLLPAGHPVVEIGMAVFCGSSQAVKRSYETPAPRESEARHRWGVAAHVTVAATALTATCSAKSMPGMPDVSVTVSMEGSFTPAKTPERNEPAARAAFERLGDTSLRLDAWSYDNSGGLYAPPSMLNDLRRRAAEAFEQALADTRGATDGRSVASALAECHATPAPGRDATTEWLLKTDRCAHLAAFSDDDLRGAADVTLDISVDPFDQVSEAIARLTACVGPDRVRLALPILTREHERAELVQRIAALRERGMRRWEIGNLSGWSLLGIEPTLEAVRAADLDIAGDWALYTMNGAAAQAWGRMGLSRATVSIEGHLDTMRAAAGSTDLPLAAVVYQDTPLFLSESCAWATLCGACATPARCTFTEIPLSMDGGIRLRIGRRQCRTVATMERPLCLAGRLGDLAEAGINRFSVQFVWREYAPEDARDVWLRVRTDRPLANTHCGNLSRGFIQGPTGGSDDAECD